LCMVLEHSDPAHQVLMQNPVSLGTRLLLILEHVISHQILQEF